MSVWVSITVLIRIEQLQSAALIRQRGEADLISINYRDPRPIYEQIKDGLRLLIITGAMTPGDKMPSVRELAGQLAINPNTIQRAYRELELEGYIYSVPGKGSFACERKEVDDGRIKELLKQFDEAVHELKYLGMTAQELKDRVEKDVKD